MRLLAPVELTSGGRVGAYEVGLEQPVDERAHARIWLKAATDAGENILVTVWQPHWACDSFNLKNLDDPKGAMGGSEDMSSVSWSGRAHQW